MNHYPLKIGDKVIVSFRTGCEADIIGTVTRPECATPDMFEFTNDHDYYDQLGRTWRSPRARYVIAGTKHLALYDKELIAVIENE